MQGGLAARPTSEKVAAWFDSGSAFLLPRRRCTGVPTKRTLGRLAIGYALDGEILYKRRKDRVLLRCVDAFEAKKILEEVHEGVCGMHANSFTMARQIMRFGYYWSTMEGDCIRYAKKCHKCQIYGDKIHVPPSPLHVMTSP
ncbi:hypothetical protein CXB51_036539 [Gossypium anomalum]|uniref:Integrase zinc-binding domain-containing protein n=1 Tax=Gossypium anomalum TaxID=47600 RepID=A0A8J5XLQ3_9ROSI|nr:hypothetical protein CXB51_036539 [Gossypium anomalum]